MLIEDEELNATGVSGSLINPQVALAKADIDENLFKLYGKEKNFFIAEQDLRKARIEEFKDEGQKMLSGTGEIIKDSARFISERADAEEGTDEYFELIQYKNGQIMYWDINDIDLPETPTKHEAWLIDVCRYNNGKKRFINFFNQLK